MTSPQVSDEEVSAANCAADGEAAKWHIASYGSFWVVSENIPLDEAQIIHPDRAVVHRFDSKELAEWFKRGKVLRAALTAAAQVRERAGTYLCRMPGGIHGGSCPTCGCEVIAADDQPTEAPSAAELAAGQIVTVVMVTDDGMETERVPWSEIMNPPTEPDSNDDLARTRRAAKGHSSVAKHNATVAEAAIAEVDRLRAALETIAGLPDVRCDEAPTVARNTLNDGTRPGPFPTEPDSGPDVLGEQKGEE